MLSTSGLWYRAFAVGGIIVLLGVVGALLSWCVSRKRKKTKKSHSKKAIIRDSITCSVILLIGFAILLWYSNKAISPNIACYQGSFEYSYRDSRVAPPLPFTSGYVFSNEQDESKKTFYIDSFSKKDIFYEKFEESAQYTIWFDKETKVILKVEKSEE